MTKLLISLLMSAIAITTTAQELVQWRGDNRTGIYNETGLLKEWPAEGPKLLWHYDGLGKGFTSVTIVNDIIYTTGESDGNGHLFAFNLQGKLLWKTVYGKEWDASYPGARTTPVFYKGNLYLATGMGEAICLEAATGNKVWSIDMKEKFGARNLRWGIVEAPVVYEDKVFFTPGGTDVTMVALNAKTGATIWTSKLTGEESAYCSPLLYQHNGKMFIATSLATHVVGVDIADGKLLWQIEQKTRYNIHPNTPIYKNGFIYSITGYGLGSVMIKLSQDGRSATEVWRNTTMDNQIGGAVWLNNMIISSGHQNDRNWQSLDAKTGEVLFKTNAIGKGAVVYADGLFYCYADNGELGILEISNNEFKLKSKFRINLGSDQHWAHPVIKDGIMYIRRGNTLMAYSIKK